MFAVIKTGGKQHIITLGETIQVEKLEATEGEVVFPEVLMVSEEDGSEAQIGSPTLDIEVKGEILSQGREDKVLVVKRKAKKRTLSRRGHRQPYTEVKITQIGSAKV